MRGSTGWSTRSIAPCSTCRPDSIGIVTLDGRSLTAWVDVVQRLRQVAYDVALDFQGLMKSAVLARASGARRVAGFSIWHLREKAARPFYSETDDGGEGVSAAASHVIHKNLHLLRVLGVQTSDIVFPLATVTVGRRVAARRRAVRADQSRRGVAQQALVA